jgi:hypothetical protein
MNPDGRDKMPAEAGCSRRKRIFIGGSGASGAMEDCGDCRRSYPLLLYFHRQWWPAGNVSLTWRENSRSA